MKIFCSFLLLLLPIVASSQQVINISAGSSPQIAFATSKIESGLLKKGYTVTFDAKSKSNHLIVIASADDIEMSKLLPSHLSTRWANLKPEGFIIHRQKTDKEIIYVIGKDHAGAMYGGLELAERIAIGELNVIADITQNPHMKRRGIKMNIPLDARTPSYTDASDTGQHNIAEMWSMDFWKEHIDSLASYRYNFISLWSLHPFPSLVKVPEYPDVALNDVHRSTIEWAEYYSTRGTGLDGPDVVDRYEVVKKISIEEKIAFWQAVMRYARDRNIDFYIVTWNVFTNSTRGKYGITDDLNNPITKDYFRKSVKQLFITYPDLKGIGLTTGENMPGADFEAKENWAFETYGRGVLDVVKEQPERKVTFIHRQHETGALDIAEKFAPLVDNSNINFIFSFKYAKAHVYSSLIQPYHPEFVKEIQSRGNLKTLWTLRNDDVYHFRWGAPDFVREFIRNIPTDVSEGYYFGSDQHVWGREFMDKNPEGKRPIELAKHWYHWMLWGRLGYDPTLDNPRLVKILEYKFPGVDGQKLFDAWQSASMIYPLTTGFHWGALDFQWYIEGCKSRPEPAQTPSGYHDINRFITLPPHNGTGFISIPDFVKNEVSGKKTAGITPLAVADSLKETSDRALNLLHEIPAKATELFRTKEDIRAMAYLGQYYAYKIEGATYSALFKEHGDQAHQLAMEKALNLSASYWRKYASAALVHYNNPLWTNRVGYVDWRKIYDHVLNDITASGGKVMIMDMDFREGVMTLEAEKGNLTRVDTDTSVPGFKGEGYVKSTSAGGTIKWQAEVPQTGKYIIGLRYILDGAMREGTVSINAGSPQKITFWKSGSSRNWVVDEVQLTLEKGKQTLEIHLPENVLLDAISILKN